jgi:hypothetical protein
MATYGPPFVYSKALLRNGGFGPGAEFFGGPPEGYRWIIRDLFWYQPAPGLDFGGGILATNGGGPVISGFLYPPGTNSNTFIDAGRFIVLDYGDDLYVQVTVGGTTICVSGQELTLP